LKAAELASGLGAIVLGAGLALVLPDWLRNYALPLLVVGVVVHGLGMSLKYRVGAPGRPTLVVGADAVLAVLGRPRWARRLDCCRSHRCQP
jgi:hypothetical protein